MIYRLTLAQTGGRKCRKTIRRLLRTIQPKADDQTFAGKQVRGTGGLSKAILEALI